MSTTLITFDCLVSTVILNVENLSEVTIVEEYFGRESVENCDEKKNGDKKSHEISLCSKGQSHLTLDFI
jgi:hypothetical protein